MVEINRNDLHYIGWKNRVITLVENLELTDMIEYDLPERQLQDWYQANMTPENVGYLIQMEGI